MRIYERDTDALFLRHFRQSQDFASEFFRLALGALPPGRCEARPQVRHKRDPGTIDLELQFRGGPVLLIENKIDACYSVTSQGDGQPQRYRRSVQAFRQAGREAFSVLLAPRGYIAQSRLAELFDARVEYEQLRAWLSGDDGLLLDAAIEQAQAPYEPVANFAAGEFFSAARQLITEHFPDLVMKRDPNPDGVRPDESRTIYFDVSRTLRSHAGVPKPRMSLQCLDKAAPSASAKIMLPNAARKAGQLSAPETLKDIGGYLRPAGRSLGIVIDTPRLDTQRPLAEQADDMHEALEAAVRLQRWWNENPDLLRAWCE